MKHCKVEVYLLELNLCENDNMEKVVTRHFSKADTIGIRFISLSENISSIFMTDYIHFFNYYLLFFSPLDTIEKEMRSLFDIPSEKETRLWNKYMSNTYEQLNKLDSTVQDAGLFQGQVNHCTSFHLIPVVVVWLTDVFKGFMNSHNQSHLTPQVLVIEKKNEDGTWPRQTCHSKYVHAV